MKVLQLCSKPPFPAKDGGCIAMNNISTGLIEAGIELKILTLETHKHPFEKNKISKEYITNTEIESVFIDTKLSVVDAFSNLVTRDSYNISRYFSADFDIKLGAILKRKKFDVVHLESLFMTPYIETIRRFSKAKIVLRSHNLEYIIWERLAEATKSKPRKTYLNLLAKRLKKYETDIINMVDGIVTISAVDETKYKKFDLQVPIINIPFGIPLEKYPLDYSTTEYPSLFHLGSMDWKPNIEGVEWFIDKIWPSITLKMPQVKLYLAGREMPKNITNWKLPNVIVLGEIESAVKFMQSKSVMIVPLLSAGGIRVKIIEGLALGKTIISTKIGAEGIDYKNGENILIANNAEEFTASISKLFVDEEYFKTIGRNARKLAEEKFDNKVLTKQLVDFYKRTLVK
jgi:polysaccharide biosynthesis protein PslH